FRRLFEVVLKRNNSELKLDISPDVNIAGQGRQFSAFGEIQLGLREVSLLHAHDRHLVKRLKPCAGHVLDECKTLLEPESRLVQASSKNANVAEVLRRLGRGRG